MRNAFHEELADLRCQLATMCDDAADAMRRSTRALVDTDVHLAEHVISADAELDRARHACEVRAYTLLALQSPVAKDLRTIVAAVYAAESLERMGDLAAHIADTTRLSSPAPAVPAEMQDDFATLGRLTVAMAEHVHTLITGSATKGFIELHRAHDAVELLSGQIIATLTNRDWPHGIRTAVNAALLTRYYERFAAQAVSTARRLDFAATGTLPTQRQPSMQANARRTPQGTAGRTAHS